MGEDRTTPFGFRDHPCKASRPSAEVSKREAQAGQLVPGVSSLFDLKPLLPSGKQQHSPSSASEKGCLASGHGS